MLLYARFFEHVRPLLVYLGGLENVVFDYVREVFFIFSVPLPADIQGSKIVFLLVYARFLVKLSPMFVFFLYARKVFAKGRPQYLLDTCK